MELHKGHRERLKRRYSENGLDSFEEHNVLELLLFYAYPRIDTNEIAHRLINRFGSLTSVLNADAAALKEVEGVGDNAALFLNLMRDTAFKYILKNDENTIVINNTFISGEFLSSYFRGVHDERAFLLCLDSKFRMLSCNELSRGGIDTVSVTLRNTMEAALVSGCTYVILTHNHTSGVALPSQTDIITTSELAATLRPIGIYLADHVVFGSEHDYVSMLESGFLDAKTVAALPKNGYTIYNKNKHRKQPEEEK